MGSITETKGGVDMPKVFVVANQKGGVGKTVTAMCLSQLLSEKGIVLAIDLDSQGNLTHSLGGDKSTLTGAAEVLRKDNPASISDAIQGVSDTLHILPGTRNLAALELEGHDMGIYWRLLKRVIEPLSFYYDYVIIDTPPALGVTNAMALTACKNGGVIVPAFPDGYSEEGIKEFYVTAEQAREFSNPGLEILGILITNHNAQTNLGKKYIERFEEMAVQMGTKVFDTKIRRNIKLAEAASNSINVNSLRDIAPKLLEDCDNFINELLNEERKGVEVNE